MKLSFCDLSITEHTFIRMYKTKPDVFKWQRSQVFPARNFSSSAIRACKPASQSRTSKMLHPYLKILGLRFQPLLHLVLHLWDAISAKYGKPNQLHIIHLLIHLLQDFLPNIRWHTGFFEIFRSQISLCRLKFRQGLQNFKSADFFLIFCAVSARLFLRLLELLVLFLRKLEGLQESGW